MSGTSTVRLPDDEYDRRKKFLESLKILATSEYIEIARILQRHKYIYSENTNGIFFNVASLPQEVFDDLEKYIEFTQLNKKMMNDRDNLMNKFEIKPLNDTEMADYEAAREAIQSKTHTIS
jgi:hypothetical protein